MRAPPPREGHEELAVFDLAKFLRAVRYRDLAALYLTTTVDRLDAGTTFAPGASIVTCAVVEGQTKDPAILSKIDRHGFERSADGMPRYPMGAVRTRLYVSLHETTRTKPKPEWVMLYERDDGTGFYLLPRGEAATRVFSGNLAVPFWHAEENERWLVCQSDALDAAAEAEAKRLFESRARSPAAAALRAMASLGYEVTEEDVAEVLDVDR